MINQTLNDRYRILAKLEDGGFSEIFLAQDLLCPKSSRCVVKALKRDQADDPFATAQRHLETEVKILHQFGHLTPQIPALLDHFTIDDSLYLVQEFIEGQPLAQELDKPWSQSAVIHLLRELLSVLQFLHSHQIIHGDVKPSNLLRRQDGRLVLIDFGAVRFATGSFASSSISSSVSSSIGSSIGSSVSLSARSTEQSDDAVIGTVGYMPNEQQAGRSRFSSDIYALGMVAIQCITGNHPRDLPEDPQTGEILWHAKLHPQFAKILQKMTRVCLRDRYLSATDVLIDLDQFERSQHTKPFALNWLLGGALVSMFLILGSAAPSATRAHQPTHQQGIAADLTSGIHSGIIASTILATGIMMTRLRLW
jgi:eukaryotic-like serine/threonine-protein kinase